LSSALPARGRAPAIPESILVRDDAPRSVPGIDAHALLHTATAAPYPTGPSIRTLRRRIANGELDAYRSGARVIRVNPDDVDRPDGGRPWPFRGR